MTAQHTPGRLFASVQIFDNDGTPETAIQALDGAATVAVALDFGSNNPGMREANARRLAACWNACEMVSTEDLEALTRPGDVSWAFTIDRVVRERDELLAALKLADCLLSGANMNRAVVERKVRAAIAKAEGGAA